MNYRTSTALIALPLIAGAAGAQSTQPVEWKVSEGGNGHWYQLVYNNIGDSEEFILDAYYRNGFGGNGHAVTISSAAENSFVRTVSQGQGTLLGLRGVDNAGFFGWITGEPLAFTNWVAGSGNGRTAIYARMQPGSSGDWVAYQFQTGCSQFVLEWDSDCNNDGIVDYGQLLRGELEDLNFNRVPDICETSISSVLPPSVSAQGGSTITIRGIGFPSNPTVLVGGVPATNVVRESISRITATSPAVMPGMKSVSVNGFTLPDGIYIRPECGSDLDQDGEVTAADIAIVLLDFGPCYSNAANTQPDDSTPFLLKEEPAPAVSKAR
jgi:hypothetical protein